MEIPSFLPIPDAESGWADCTLCHPLGHMLLWTAVLFLGKSESPEGREEQEQRQVSFPNSAAATWLELSLGEDEGWHRKCVRKVRRVKAG